MGWSRVQEYQGGRIKIMVGLVVKARIMIREKHIMIKDQNIVKISEVKEIGTEV